MLCFSFLEYLHAVNTWIVVSGTCVSYSTFNPEILSNEAFTFLPLIVSYVVIWEKNMLREGDRGGHLCPSLHRVLVGYLFEHLQFIDRCYKWITTSVEQSSSFYLNIKLVTWVLVMRAKPCYCSSLWHKNSGRLDGP